MFACYQKSKLCPQLDVFSVFNMSYDTLFFCWGGGGGFRGWGDVNIALQMRTAVDKLLK